jgi:3-deoxy-7-phosphoheptulonate synthase
MQSKPTNNVRIASLRPLIPPGILIEEIPATPAGLEAVGEHRAAVANCLHGKDSRLVVVVGPCSIHDPRAALEYADKLQRLRGSLADDLCIVMRVYFEKPRTTIGWKGLINDPHLDSSFAINQGLRIARGLLRDIVDLGLPAGCEFLDPISPQFISDLVSWGAIGARTTESQVHRELASGSSMPVGFKNGTDGNIKIAVEGVISSQHPHSFLGVSEQGLAAIVSTRGNPHCHVILRGGEGGPNYHAEAVGAAVGQLAKAKLAPRVMVDASHGNSGKDYRRQPEVVRNVCHQIAGGQDGIFGVMLESFLLEGRQELGADLKYGQSITDGCIGWETTQTVLLALAKAVQQRRGAGRLTEGG